MCPMAVFGGALLQQGAEVVHLVCTAVDSSVDKLNSTSDDIKAKDVECRGMVSTIEASRCKPV